MFGMTRQAMPCCGGNGEHIGNCHARVQMKRSTTEDYPPIPRWNPTDSIRSDEYQAKNNADAQLARDIEAARGVKPALQRQEGGDHYKGRAIQPIEYIHANGLGFIEGSIVKYITRWRDKGGTADIRKIIHYCELLLELEVKEFVRDGEQNVVDDGWVEWHGGENPVPGKVVEVKYSTASPPAQPHRSEMFRWRHAYEDDSTAFPSFNIIAYRVV